MLHAIASHPTFEWHHQLAYVSQQATNTKGHTETDFFWWKNSSECTTFSKWLTGQHHAVCNTITHFTSADYHVLEYSTQIPLRDTKICATVTHSIPRGNVEYRRASWGRGEKENPILRQSGCLTKEVIPESTHVGKKNLHSEHFIVPGALNFYSARGTDLLWCQGHGTFWVLGAQDFLRVPGTQVSHNTAENGVGSDQVRKAFHFSCHNPTPDWSWGIIV